MFGFETGASHLHRSLIATVWDVFDRLTAMTWKSAEDTDREVRLRMKAKGWKVTAAEYDYERKIYTWRARSLRSAIRRLSEFRRLPWKITRDLRF